MTVDLEAVPARGRMGSGGLLRAGCEGRLGGNLTGKGGARIGWAGMRSVPEEERVQGSSVRRREREGHSCCSREGG